MQNIVATIDSTSISDSETELESKTGRAKRSANKARRATAGSVEEADSAKGKRKAKNTAESAIKLQELLDFDREMARKWLRSDDAALLGTDEVGRGCIAGPVVAAAVKLPNLLQDSDLLKALRFLNDSKKLSPQIREELSAVLTEHCQYAIGVGSVEEIDSINILKASLLAMRRAVDQLEVPESSVVLVDGNQKISALTQRQIQVIGGDGVSASIAAASVIAKVYRDRLMRGLHIDFPHYAWDKNKGYGSKTHCDALQSHGLTPFHRKAFCTRIMQEQLSFLDA